MSPPVRPEGEYRSARHESTPVTRRSLPRPVFFDLTLIQLPVGALTSIAHRVTGIC